MKHLLIIGARGYGRGVYDIARNSYGYGSEFVIKGYLDDKSDALDGYSGYPPIISSVEDYTIQPDDVFICALGDVSCKKKYVKMVLEKGGTFINIVHNSVTIGSNVKMGVGCIAGYNSQIDCDVTIGDFVNIQTNVVVGHDSKVGSWSILDCFSFMGGFAVVGDSVTLHTRATIVPKIVVGDNSVINANSLVIRNVEPNSLMMGNPAKKLIVPNFK